MASEQVLTILAIIVVALPALAKATEHVVGDDSGWTLHFNYTAWTEGKDFLVGDTLVFKYPKGYHNVFKVSGPDFLACNVPPANESLASGNDVITLATPGKKWYICGKADGKHCEAGQKLVITVQPAAGEAPALLPIPVTWPAPAPSPLALAGPTQYVVGDHYGWTINFNYTAWAKGREFRVGDSLVFKYPVGRHNVFKVNGTDFQTCKVPPANEALTTGNDVITLATPGRKWYICGVGYGSHCLLGQKLAITVLPAAWQAPASSTSGLAASHAHSPSPNPSPSPRHWFGNLFLKH